jgi:hypothetical protein
VIGKKKLGLLVYYKEQQGSGGQRTCNNKQCQCHPIVQKDTLLFLSFFLSFVLFLLSVPSGGKDRYTLESLMPSSVPGRVGQHKKQGKGLFISNWFIGTIQRTG